MDTISNFHTTGIIHVENSKFTFFCSIPESMLCDVPTASKILKGYWKTPASCFRPLTHEMQSIIAEAEKPKKGG